MIVSADATWRGEQKTENRGKKTEDRKLTSDQAGAKMLLKRAKYAWL